MSKVVYFIFLGGLVLAAVAVININRVNAYDGSKFIPISVLSKKQANYGTDANPGTIPAVSADILEDKVRDIQAESSVQIIRYTSLPLESQEETGQDSDNTQSVHPGGSLNNQGNNHSNPPGSGNSNQNMNNGNSNAGGGNNNSNNGQEKGKGKETKPDKNSAPQDKATTPENKGPAAEAAPDKIK